MQKISSKRCLKKPEHFISMSFADTQVIIHNHISLRACGLKIQGIVTDGQVCMSTDLADTRHLPGACL